MSATFDFWLADVDRLLAKEGLGVTHRAFDPSDLQAAFDRGQTPVQFVMAVKAGTAVPIVPAILSGGVMPSPGSHADPLSSIEAVNGRGLASAMGFVWGLAVLNAVLGALSFVVGAIVLLPFGSWEDRFRILVGAGAFGFLSLAWCAWAVLLHQAVALLAEIARRLAPRD